MNRNWNSRFSFSGKCEQICLELTWHPYGESKPCDPDSLFPVVKGLFEAERWELAWEEIYLSSWPDRLLCNFWCGYIYFYLSPYKVMRILVASKPAGARLGRKNKPWKDPRAKKIAVWRNLRSVPMINNFFVLLGKTEDSAPWHFETLQLSRWNVLCSLCVPSSGGGSWVSVVSMSFYLPAAAIFHR